MRSLLAICWMLVCSGMALWQVARWYNIFNGSLTALTGGFEAASTRSEETPAAWSPGIDVASARKLQVSLEVEGYYTQTLEPSSGEILQSRVSVVADCADVCNSRADCLFFKFSSADGSGSNCVLFNTTPATVGRQNMKVLDSNWLGYEKQGTGSSYVEQSLIDGFAGPFVGWVWHYNRVGGCRYTQVASGVNEKLCAQRCRDDYDLCGGFVIGRVDSVAGRCLVCIPFSDSLPLESPVGDRRGSFFMAYDAFLLTGEEHHTTSTASSTSTTTSTWEGAVIEMYFGEDPGDARGNHPESDRKQQAFLQALRPGVRVEGFESFPSGREAPLTVTFPGSSGRTITADITGNAIVSTTRAVSGKSLQTQSPSDFLITFSEDE